MIGGGKCGGGSSDGSGCSGCGFGTAEGKTAAVNNSTGLMTAGLGGRPLFFLGGERSSSSPAVLAAVSASEPYFIVSFRIRFALPLPFVVVGARVVSLLPFIIIMIIT